MIKLIIIVVLLDCSFVLSQHGSFVGSNSNTPLCVKATFYCEESRDCCSKSCVAKKCVGNGTPPPTKGNPQQTTPANVLDNRFDDGKSCQQTGQYCQTGTECCSGECIGLFRKCASTSRLPNPSTNEVVNQGQPQTINSGTTCSVQNQQCSASRSCCAFLTCEGSICRDKAVVIEGTETFGYNPGNNLDNRFGEGENVSNSTQVPTAPVNTKCSEIGSKCFDESDCCRNLRCHGFLHQCVT